MFKLIKSRYTPQQRMQIILPSVQKGLTVYGNQFAGQLNAVTANWQHRVRFAAEVNYRSSTELTLRVFIPNASTRLSQRYGGTYGSLWDWIEHGTQAHTIYPRPDNPWGKLFFQGGDYAPKTSPGLFYGGPGQVIGGGLVAAAGVQHPGTTARRFVPGFDKKLAPDRKKAIDGAFREAFRLMMV